MPSSAFIREVLKLIWAINRGFPMTLMEDSKEKLIQRIQELEKENNELKEEKIFSNALIEAIPGLFHVYDEDLKLVRWNKYHEVMTGYSSEELQNFDLFNFLGDDQKDKVEKVINETIATGASQERFVVTRKGGDVLPVFARTSFAEISGEKYFIGISLDLTRLENAEKLNVQNSAFYYGLFEAASDAIILMSSDRIIDCNEKALKLFDSNKEDIIGATPMDFSPEFQPDGKESFKKAEMLINKAYDGHSQRFEWQHNTSVGRAVDTEVSLSCIDLENQKFLLAIIRDISERRNIENERRQLQKQVFQASKLASIGELAAGVAHEINNPLAVLMGHKDMIEKHIIKNNIQVPEIRRALDKQEIAMDRIKKIVDGLRAHSRNMDDTRECFDINQCIDSSLDLTAFLYKRDGVDIEFCKGTGFNDLVVDGNPGKFQQVIINLLSNARDAMERSKVKHIKICTGQEGEKVGIRISDTGEGIPPEKQDAIFGSFFTTKEIGKGTGLGLSITKSIVDEMGGKIRVESSPGEGTTFQIMLPKSKALKAPRENKQDIKVKYNLKGHVLVIDDEVEIRELLQSMLMHFGLSADIASNGEEALELVKEHHYDYLITDIHMPVMSGDTFLQEVHNLGLLDQARKIVITGTLDSANSLELDVDSTLGKPFSMKSIYSALKGDS